MSRLSLPSRTSTTARALVRGDRLGILDELQRLVGQVLGQVVALLRRLRRLDRKVVIDQVRVPLVGLRAEEAVEPLEAPPDRPLGLREAMFISSSAVRCHLPVT